MARGQLPDGVLSADWQEKRTFLLGEQWNVAEYRTKFDSEPSIVQSAACPRLPCPPPEDTPPICNYAKTFEECGEGPEGCDPEQIRLACLGAGLRDENGEVIREPDWIELEDGVPVFIDDHPRNTFRNFRFYVPLEPEEDLAEDRCRAFVIDIQPFTGDPDVFLNNGPPAATIVRNVYSQDNVYGGELVVCPNDPNFRRGQTVYIGVYTFALPAVYNLVVTTAILPPYFPVDNCTETNNIPCLTDGVPLQTLLTNSQFLYRPVLTSLGINWNGTETDCPVAHIGIFAEDKQVVLAIVERNTLTGETTAFMTTNGNTFVAKDFSLCGVDGRILVEEREYLVVGNVASVLPGEVIPFTLFATTYVSQQVVRLVDLPPFTAMGKISELGQDQRLSCLDFEDPFLSGARLAEAGIVYGGVTGNAYNPLPSLSEKLLRETFSTNPSWERVSWDFLFSFCFVLFSFLLFLLIFFSPFPILINSGILLRSKHPLYLLYHPLYARKRSPNHQRH